MTFLNQVNNQLPFVIDVIPPKCLESLALNGLPRDKIIQYAKSSQELLFTTVNCSFDNCRSIAAILKPFTEENPHIKDRATIDSHLSFINGYEYMQHIVFKLNTRLPVDVAKEAYQWNLSK